MLVGPHMFVYGPGYMFVGMETCVWVWGPVFSSALIKEWATKVPWKCCCSVVEVKTANSHSHRPSPANSPTIHSRLVQNCAFYLHWERKKHTPFYCFITGQYDKYVLWHHKHTHIGTSKLYDWPGPEGQSVKILCLLFCIFHIWSVRYGH